MACEFLPRFNIGGDIRFQYLSQGGYDYTADQAMLDQAKSQGAVGSQAGVPFTAMHTVTAMDYLDSKPQRFVRGAPCYAGARDQRRRRGPLRLVPARDRSRRGHQPRGRAGGVT